MDTCGRWVAPRLANARAWPNRAVVTCSAIVPLTFIVLTQVHKACPFRGLGRVQVAPTRVAPIGTGAGAGSPATLCQVASGRVRGGFGAGCRGGLAPRIRAGRTTATHPGVDDQPRFMYHPRRGRGGFPH